MREPKQVYQRHLAAFNAKDADAEPWSTDGEFVAPGAQLRGRDEVLGFLRMFWEAFPDAHNDVSRLIAEGPRVVAEGRFTGTHTGTLRTPQGEIPPTERRVEFRWSATCEAHRDELVSEHLYFDQLDLLTQLGVMSAAPAGAATTEG
jgi:predicted ester cyclase